MSMPYLFASGLASGGRRWTWLFFIPVAVIAVAAFDQFIRWPRRDAAGDETALVAAIVLCCFALWYFVLGRIPNWSAVRNVRGQVPDAVAVYGADAFARARGTSGFAKSRANVLCISRKGLQLWTGRGDAARPIGVLKWAEIAAVSPDGRNWSSSIAVSIAADPAPLMLSVLNNRAIAMSRIRGRARARFVAQLEALRDPGPSQRKLI